MLVDPEGRAMRCPSILFPSPADARSDALASVAEVMEMIQMLALREDASEPTALVVTHPERPTFRPPQTELMRDRLGSPGALRTCRTVRVRSSLTLASQKPPSPAPPP